ncbi:hypothetical protein [Crocosphaera chwakensis]|uniref:Uncharacterized protein n=1 Tax=Crocosphaera chwakensis CCY0110 TaxID=391612 RepID=A3ISX5_9CHRO|nr:hypothetical protein [Crocosphaera chwakensis]EAZ90406.1 hypothetical protein CY0110_28774 [Crocosphaera chwakensis CCY0110]
MISLVEAERKAIEFIAEEWELSDQDKELFTVENSRKIDDRWWYIVEVTVNNLPDKWVMQVYDDGECDPCYTFVSPFSETEILADLDKIPEKLALVLQQERTGHI